MSDTIYDSALVPITGNGDTDINLVQGEDYALGIAGSFESAALTFFFVDGAANEIAVPEAGSTDSAGSGLEVSAAAIFELSALTSVLRARTSNPNSATDITDIASDADDFTVTSATHGLEVGDTVVIAGCTVEAYNGTWTVATVPDANTFTVESDANPGDADDGTATKQLTDADISVTCTRINTVKP